MFYRNPVFYVFVTGTAAFILMILITCSVPLLSSLYFLHTSEAQGVRFGVWGWCLDEYPICSPLQLGYTWPPQIPNQITIALVFYPITAFFSILTMISLIPITYTRNARADRVFLILAWTSFASSTIAFSFMIGMWTVAKHRFEERGFGASYGPLPWLSLTATLLLFAVALSPIAIGPLPRPKVATPKKRLRRVKNFQQLEASAARQKRQQQARYMPVNVKPHS